MGDYIRRQDAIDAIQKAYVDTEEGEDKCAVWKNIGLTNALHIMQDLPSARRTGEWVELGENKDGTHNIRCNQCGEAFKSRGHANSYNTKRKYRFCPFCGSNMIGECIYKRDLDGKTICYIDGYELSEGYCEICDRKVVDGK